MTSISAEGDPMEMDQNPPSETNAEEIPAPSRGVKRLRIKLKGNPMTNNLIASESLLEEPIKNEDAIPLEDPSEESFDSKMEEDDEEAEFKLEEKKPKSKSKSKKRSESSKGKSKKPTKTALEPKKSDEPAPKSSKSKSESSSKEKSTKEVDNAKKEEEKEKFPPSPVLVFQLGSHSIKFGRASDPYHPQMCINVVARRKKKGAKTDSQPSVASYDEDEVKNALKEVEQEFKRNINAIDNQLNSRGYEKVEQFELKREMQLGQDIEFQYSQLSDQVPYLIGEPALRISPNQPHDLFWPIQNGSLSIGPDRPLRVVVTQLELVLEHILLKEMKLPKEEWNSHQILLIVPDEIIQEDLRIYADIFFNTFGFGSMVFQIASSCAVFAASLPHACVVDIGHQTTSVVCVEDGISLPQTRICMNFGGENINRRLEKLLKSSKRHKFPYEECEMDRSPLDAEIINNIKEEFAHLEEAIPIEQVHFRVRREGKNAIHTTQYKCNASESLFLAPYGLFKPELLQPIRPYEPPHFKSLVIDNLYEHARKKKEKEDDGEDRHAPRSLDQAIASSIGYHGDRMDSKKKFLGSILLVGGSSKFDGLKDVVQYKVQQHFGDDLEVAKAEVHQGKREIPIDPLFQSWRGGAIFSTIESAEDYMIRASEWNMLGMRVLKEKTPFLWE